MGLFGSSNEEKEKKLKARDWSSSHASSIQPRPMSASGTVEIHKCLDGNFRIEKDGFGNIISARKA